MMTQAQAYGHRGLDLIDNEVRQILEGENTRQQETICLIASENYASAATMTAVGSVFTNKYAEGYSGKRYYGGCAYMDAVEDVAIARAKKLFGAEHVNVQAHSGSQANTAVYFACLKPGDTILSMDLAHGGHLTAGLKVNISGRLYNIVHYGLDKETERINYDHVEELAREHKPQLIIAGASSYPREIDFTRFSQIARQVGAKLMCDIAHIAGLVCTGLHNNPVSVADFVTTTTHKTLRGPRGGMVMCRSDYAKPVDVAVFPGLQGGPLMHAVAGKAVAFGEALSDKFKQYQKNVIANAAALGETMTEKGFRVVTGGTDNHLILVDLRKNFPDVTGAMAEQWMEQAGIVCNKNLVPFDDRKPMETSGLRLGAPAGTTRGFTADHYRQIGAWIHEAISANGDEKVLSNIAGQVRELCHQHPIET